MFAGFHAQGYVVKRGQRNFGRLEIAAEDGDML